MATRAFTTVTCDLCKKVGSQETVKKTWRFRSGKADVIVEFIARSYLGDAGGAYDSCRECALNELKTGEKR